MTVIDRYIAKTFLGGYLILLAVGIGMYILADLLVNIDEFTGEDEVALGETFRLILDFYGYNLPLYFSQLGGPMMAIAGSFTLGIMLRNNEQTALVAAGVPLQRLVVPIIACSVVVVAAWMVNREVLIPMYAHKIARSHSDILGERVEGVYCARDDRNAILTALELNDRTGVLKDVYIIEPDADGRPRFLIQADRARYDASVSPPTWRLAVGRRLTMRDRSTPDGLGGPIRYEPVDSFRFGLSPEQLALRQAGEWSELLSIEQMSGLLEAGNLPNRPIIEMNRHVRLVQPLLQWILLALSLPFFLQRAPGNVLVAGGKTMALTGTFFGVSFFAHSLVGDGTWAAFLAWLPVLLFGPVAVLQVANVRT